MLFSSDKGRKAFNLLRKFLLAIFAGFNLAIAIQLFMLYAENENMKIVYAIFGVAFGLFIFTTIIMLKTAYKYKQRYVLAGYLILYALLVFISIMGAIGYNINSVNNQSKAIVLKNSPKDNISKRLDLLNNEIISHSNNIATYEASIKAIPLKNIDKINKVIGYKNTESNAITAAQNEITEISFQASKEPDSGIVSNDIFNSIGSILKIEGSDAKSLIFILMILIINFGEFSNAPTLNNNVKLNGNITTRKMDIFIDALFNVNGVRLSNNDSIMEQTNLLENEVKDIREYLMGLKWKGDNILVNKGKGKGTQSSVKKESFKTIVKVLLNSEDIA